jgi:hypothetical protein
MLPGPVDRAPTTQSDRGGEPGMANASDRWPKYRTPLNEWIPAWQVKRSGGSVVCPVCPAGDHTRKQFLAVGSDREAVL